MSQAENQASENSIVLKIRRTASILEIIAIGFVIISIFSQSLKYWTDFENVFGLVRLFNITLAFSMPTIYSVILLLILSILFGLISANQVQNNGIFYRHWIFLSILTLYLSINRGSHVHNLVIRPVVRLLQSNIDFLTINRLNVTILLLILIFSFFFRRFYLSLPKKTRSRLHIAILVYLSGFSLLTADPEFLVNSGDFILMIKISFGKFLELSGMVLLISACLDYINRTFNSISLEFNEMDGENKHLRVNDHLIINIRPEIITRLLLAAAFLLALISLSAQLFKYLGNSENGMGLIPMMDVDRESSVPTMFSVQLLFIAALLFMGISTLKHFSKDKFRWYWTGLASGFLFMTFDEGASIHELLTMPMKNFIGDGLPSFFTFAWVIPIGIIVVILALVYIRFIIALPNETRQMIIISAMLYLGGAVGVEMIGGSYAHSHTIHNLNYNIIVTIEEMLEMAGTIFLILTLTNYFKNHHRPVTIQFQP